MALALAGADAQAVRTLPWFMREGAWDDAALRQRHGQEVATCLGEDAGVRPLDGRDVRQQGQASVGGTRHYGGEVGKRAHGHAGVSLGEASRQGDTLGARRLSVPQAGVANEAAAARRRRCGVPAALPCKTKPRLGGEMRQAGHPAGTVRARWVACDAALGRDTRLLAPSAGMGLWYCAEVPHAPQVWRHRPAPAGPLWAGQGRHPTRTRVPAGAIQPAAVAPRAADHDAARGGRRTIQAGRTGPLVAHGAARRGSAGRDGWPGPEGWLGLRRHLVTGAWKTSLAKAPADTPLATLGRLRGMRWPLETCCEDGKHSLGMGDDAVRRWRGWPHPMTRGILAHFLLVRTWLK